MSVKIVNEAVKLRRQMLEAAEAILRSEAEGAILTADEISVLEAAGIDSKRHQSELARIRRVMRFEAESGTLEQRDRLEKQIESAKQARDAKLPKLRKELEEIVERLEGQIQELNDAVEIPEQKLQKMQQASEQLRHDSILPKHVADEANHRRGRTKEQYHEVACAESRANVLKEQIALLQQANESDRRFQDIVNNKKLFGMSQGYAVLDKQKLTSYIDQLREELAEAEAIVAEGMPEFRKALAEAESVRDYYLR